MVIISSARSVQIAKQGGEHVTSLCPFEVAKERASSIDIHHCSMLSLTDAARGRCQIAR